MVSRGELLSAIRELEGNADSYSACAKLATFYVMHDHLYPSREAVATREEAVVGSYGDTDFLKAVEGMGASAAWAQMDDLMSTLQAVQPRLYNAVMAKLGKGT